MSEERPRIYLDTVEEEDVDGRALIHGTGKIPMMTGTNESAPDLYCGACRALLTVGMLLAQFDYGLLVCPDCGTHNDTA